MWEVAFLKGVTEKIKLLEEGLYLHTVFTVILCFSVSEAHSQMGRDVSFSSSVPEVGYVTVTMNNTDNNQEFLSEVIKGSMVTRNSSLQSFAGNG